MTKKIDYWMPVDQYVGGRTRNFTFTLFSLFTKSINFCNKKNNRTFQKSFYSRNGLSSHRSNNNWLFPDEVERLSESNVVKKLTNLK